MFRPRFANVQSSHGVSLTTSQTVHVHYIVERLSMRTIHGQKCTLLNFFSTTVCAIWLAFLVTLHNWFVTSLNIGLEYILYYAFICCVFFIYCCQCVLLQLLHHNIICVCIVNYHRYWCTLVAFQYMQLLTVFYSVSLILDSSPTHSLYDVLCLG